MGPFGANGIKVFTTRSHDLIVHAGHEEITEGDGQISRR